MRKWKFGFLAVLSIAAVAISTADVSAWGWWRYRLHAHKCGTGYNAFSPRSSGWGGCGMGGGCRLFCGAARSAPCGPTCAPSCPAPRAKLFSGCRSKGWGGCGCATGGSAGCSSGCASGCGSTSDLSTSLASPVMPTETIVNVDPSLVPFLGQTQQTAIQTIPSQMQPVVYTYPMPYAAQPYGYTGYYQAPVPYYYYPMPQNYPNYGYPYGYQGYGYGN